MSPNLAMLAEQVEERLSTLLPPQPILKPAFKSQS